MSTNSVVAVATPSGFKGRYVHWDGYPAGVGQAIADIVKRDGYADAILTLVHAHYGWSSLNGEAIQEADRAPERFIPVPGYGMAYSADEQPDEWITEAGQTQEYAYVVTRTAVETWVGRDGTWMRFPEYDIAI